jgi:hypothetical protein
MKDRRLLADRFAGQRKSAMKLWLIPLILLLECCAAAAATGIKGDLYLLGIGLDQDGSAGGWTQVGPAGAWGMTIAGVVLADQIYTVESNGGLYVTDPQTGKWTQLGQLEFGDTRLIFADGSQLYTIENNGCLYRVSPADGTWAQVGPDGAWSPTIVGAVLGEHLFTVESNGGLWETDLQTGTWQQVGGFDFGATRLMFASGGALYTIETDGSLYRINPADGTWAQIGAGGAWKASTVGAILNDQLYTTQSDGNLFVTDLRTGSRRHIGAAEFGLTTYMFAVAGKLDTIETSGSLFRVSPKADTVIDAWDWCPQEIEKVFREQGKSFYHTLQSKQILGKNATHAGAMGGIAWLEQKTTANDLVVIYIGAHGGTDPKEGWGIATADKKMLWGHEIKAELAKLRCPALVLIETCGSGGFDQAHPDDPPVPANVTALCACSANQTAFNELDIAVAEALWGRADFNHDGVVDADELVRYVKLRYKEMWPDANPAGGSGTPIIVTSRRIPGAQALTKVSPQLCAVAWQNGYWSALVGAQSGGNYAVHFLGWSSKKGDSYYLTDSVPRDLICLPADGPPLLVNQNGQWIPARGHAEAGGKFAVHYLGKNQDDEVGADQIRYPFVGQTK